MNQVSKGSIIALAVFLSAVAGVWLLAGGGSGGSSQGQVPEEGPARSEDAGGKTMAGSDAATVPESGGGLTTGPTESEAAPDPDESADAGQTGPSAPESPPAGPEAVPSDPLGMRSEAEEAAREGGPEAGVAGGQRTAASSYVLYAYGYSGDEPGEYSYNLSPYIDPTSFYASEGGEKIQRYASSLAGDSGGGTEGPGGQARLEGLRKLADEDGGRERWLLRIRPGENFAANAGFPEAEAGYEQEVVLTPHEDSWRVYKAGPLEPRDEN